MTTDERADDPKVRIYVEEPEGGPVVRRLVSRMERQVTPDERAVQVAAEAIKWFFTARFPMNEPCETQARAVLRAITDDPKVKVIVPSGLRLDVGYGLGWREWSDE